MSAVIWPIDAVRDRRGDGVVPIDERRDARILRHVRVTIRLLIAMDVTSFVGPVDAHVDVGDQAPERERARHGLPSITQMYGWCVWPLTTRSTSIVESRLDDVDDRPADACRSR